MASWRVSLIGVLALIVSSCAILPSPEPEFYALAPIAGASSETAAAHNGFLIGLSEITLPAYARNQQITTAASPVQIVEDDDHRWAVPPTEAVTNALARSIETHAGATVVQTPFPRGIEPTVRVQVSFDRLLRSRQGGAHIAGQYIVVRDGGAVSVIRFDIDEASSGTAYAAYMAAMASALDDLSAMIANEIADAAE